MGWSLKGGASVHVVGDFMLTDDSFIYVSSQRRTKLQKFYLFSVGFVCKNAAEFSTPSCFDTIITAFLFKGVFVLGFFYLYRFVELKFHASLREETSPSE